MAGNEKSGKNRKIDRQRKSGQNLRYKAEGRHEKSHAERIAKHLIRVSARNAETGAPFREHKALQALIGKYAAYLSKDTANALQAAGFPKRNGVWYAPGT